MKVWKMFFSFSRWMIFRFLSPLVVWGVTVTAKASLKYALGEGKVPPSIPIGYFREGIPKVKIPFGGKASLKYAFFYYPKGNTDSLKLTVNAPEN